MLDNEVYVPIAKQAIISLLPDSEEGIELRSILVAYFKEYECGGMAKPVISKTRACTCCGEIGFVPNHHKYLCIFCWNHAGVATQDHVISTDRALDKVRINIPIGIEGTEMEPEVYHTMTFSARDYTQEQLQAMIP